jgi:hypothetical protein
VGKFHCPLQKLRKKIEEKPYKEHNRTRTTFPFLRWPLLGIREKDVHCWRWETMPNLEEMF